MTRPLGVGLSLLIGGLGFIFDALMGEDVLGSLRYWRNLR